MKRYRQGERLLAEDRESLEGLKYVGAIPWGLVGHLREYYVERLSQLVGCSAAELLGCPGFGRKAVETVQTLLAGIGLTLHPERAEPPPRRSQYQDWWESTGRRLRMDELRAKQQSALPTSPNPAPVTGREGNILHVDFRRPAPE